MFIARASYEEGVWFFVFFVEAMSFKCIYLVYVGFRNLNNSTTNWLR